MNALRHGLTAGALVLSTEDKAKFDELLGSYIDEYQPATQTESDLVQELAASKWLQRRCWALQTALLDVTMERMADEVAEEFTGIPNSMRTALAFAKEAGTNGALALLNRYAGRHSREWHKAIDKLRAIQKERAQNELGTPTAPTPGREPEEAGSSLLQNEPGQHLTPVPPYTSNPEEARPESIGQPSCPGDPAREAA